MKKKWLPVFNSILRLKFYAYISNPVNREVLYPIDREYQRFISDAGFNPDNEEVKFFGGDFLFGFVYVILVRTHEFLQNELTNENRKRILQISNWPNLSSFKEIIDFYNIDLKEFKERDVKGRPFYNNEDEKLSFLIANIRHSFSHFKYESISSDKLRLFNKYNNNIKMDCIIPKASLVDFSADYGIAVDIGLRSFFSVKRC